MSEPTLHGCRNHAISYVQYYLYHSVWAFERYRHSVQTPCTISSAFEGRVHPCTFERCGATVVSYFKTVNT